MKKHTLYYNLIGAALCAVASPLAAADFCNPCSNNYEWSCCDGKINFGADWLYWKVTEDNLSLGDIINATDDVAVHNTDFRLTDVDQKFKYTSGFRVNLGYEMPCDCWGVNVNYTYMPSNSSSNSFSGEFDELRSFFPNIVNFPIFLVGSESFLPNLLSISSKWDLTANNIDVDIGRTLCFGECIKVRPHIGFRATWFDQKLKTHIATENLDGYDLSTVEADFLFKENFRGYGVEGGLWGEWQIGCGLSFIGHVGGSILYSKIHTKQSFFALESATFGTVPEFSNTLTGQSCHTVWTATPTMDYFVGLQYADCICDMLFAARVGWEQHVIFNANRLAHDGNLGAQGLTLGFEVGF